MQLCIQTSLEYYIDLRCGKTFDYNFRTTKNTSGHRIELGCITVILYVNFSTQPPALTLWAVFTSIGILTQSLNIAGSQ